MLNGYSDILFVEDLTKILRLGKNKVYDLLKEGIIKSRRVGRKYLIPKLCVIDYLTSTRYTSKYTVGLNCRRKE